MILKFSKSLFTLILVLVCLRLPSIFMEGYHDFTKEAMVTSDEWAYPLDLCSPILLVPELVAVSLAVFVWRDSKQESDATKVIFFMLGRIALIVIFSVIALIGQMGMQLDERRPLNLYRYISTVIAVLLGAFPWVYQYLRNHKK